MSQEQNVEKEYETLGNTKTPLEEFIGTTVYRVSNEIVVPVEVKEFSKGSDFGESEFSLPNQGYRGRYCMPLEWFYLSKADAQVVLEKQLEVERQNIADKIQNKDDLADYIDKNMTINQYEIGGPSRAEREVVAQKMEEYGVRLQDLYENPACYKVQETGIHFYPSADLDDGFAVKLNQKGTEKIIADFPFDSDKNYDDYLKDIVDGLKNEGFDLSDEQRTRILDSFDFDDLSDALDSISEDFNVVFPTSYEYYDLGYTKTFFTLEAAKDYVNEASLSLGATLSIHESEFSSVSHTKMLDRLDGVNLVTFQEYDSNEREWFYTEFCRTKDGQFEEFFDGQPWNQGEEHTYVTEEFLLNKINRFNLDGGQNRYGKEEIVFGFEPEKGIELQNLPEDTRIYVIAGETNHYPLFIQEYTFSEFEPELDENGTTWFVNKENAERVLQFTLDHVYGATLFEPEKELEHTQERDTRDLEDDFDLDL